MYCFSVIGILQILKINLEWRKVLQYNIIKYSYCMLNVKYKCTYNCKHIKWNII